MQHGERSNSQWTHTIHFMCDISYVILNNDIQMLLLILQHTKQTRKRFMAWCDDWILKLNWWSKTTSCNLESKIYCWILLYKWPIVRGKVCVLLSFQLPFHLVTTFLHFPLSALTGSSPFLYRLSSFSQTISLKSTQNNFSPPNSFQRHPLPLGALQRENPFIFDSRLSRNGSNVSCNRRRV